MSPFYPMPRREAVALGALVLFSAGAFLPVFGEVSILGVAVFGWLMAALLLGSPAILLALLFAERRAPRGERQTPPGRTDP